MNFLRKWAWVGAIAFGVVLTGAGAFMVAEARSAHDEVRIALADERIITAEDADIPLQPVDSAEEAKAQADIISEHALTLSGGKTYAKMDRNDPNRATYLNSVTLRTALMESYLAFKVADLVMGVGVIVAMLGLSQVVLGVYLAVITSPARKRQAEGIGQEALGGV